MVFAEITIRVSINENEFTEEQQTAADASDTDLSCTHPLEKGIDDFVDMLKNHKSNHLSCFNYLQTGRQAVIIDVEYP